MRWAVRAIGFVNVIILARLLTPEAFGIVVMATIVIGFITSFTEMGAQQLLIREREINTQMINTAWTIRVILGVLIALFLLAIRPLAAQYFDEPRLPAVITVLSVACIIDGFYNIGITLARKELQFDVDFRASVYSRLASFFITLALVIWLRNYWALVYGKLLGSVASVAISYWLHAYRPRFCVRYFRMFLRYSYSIVPLRISTFLNEKVGSIVVGGISSAATLGIYNVASDLATMFTREIAAPLGRGLMPGYAKISDDPQGLARAFVNVLAASAAVIVPVGIGSCLVAPYLVPLFLGEQWLEAVIYMQFLSIYATLLSIQRTMSVQIFIVVGHEARAAILSWIRLAILASASVAAAAYGGALAVAQVTPVVGLLLLPVTSLFLVRSLSVTVGDIVWALWRPAVSAMVMALAVMQLDAILVAQGLPMFAMLVILVLVGAMTYVLSMAVTWVLSGKPEGLEYLADKALRSRGVG